ncbi:unnamed protein product [Calypogeia fissa]
MQGQTSFDDRNGRSADKYKAPLKEKFVSLYEDIFAGRSLIHTAKDQGVQGRAALTRFWDELLLLKVNDVFLSQFIAKASEEQLRGELKPIINGLFETYSMYLGDGNFIRVAHALETLTILFGIWVQGYTIITLVCRSVEQSDSFFRRLVTSIASLLSRDDVPVLVKSLGLRSGKVSPSLSPWPGAPGAQRMLNTGNQGTDFRRKEGIDLQMVPEEVEDVSWKKYRMDVKKSLSLNLEREPDIESGEELDSAAHEDQEASSLFTVHEKDRAPSTGMSRLLDINAVPESSSEMEVDHPEPAQLAAQPVRPPSQISVLHALYVGLKELYKLGPLKQEGDSISSRSFSLQVCAESLVDPSYSECLGLKVEGFPPSVPDNKNGHAIVAVLECSWSYEDDALTWTIVDILRRSRLKMN